MTAYNSGELDALIEDLVNHYGVERAMYVLSRTVQFSKWDERFGALVRDKADTFQFPDLKEERDDNHVDPTSRYVAQLDPCVVNAIFIGLIKKEEKQNEMELPEPIMPDEPEYELERGI